MKKKLILFGLLLCSAYPAHAANHYVRDGATGSTCADWGANACDVLPATLVRGDTYYLAAGTYAAYSFDDAQSGTTTITIKKAMVADHGTSTGWLDSYATGQAIFTGGTTLQFYIGTGYLILDGSPTNTKAATSGQGIKIDGSTCTNTNFCWTILVEAGNVTIKGIELVGMGGQPGTDPDRLDNNYRCVSSLCVNNTVQLSYFHDSSSTFFQINNSSNFLVEDTWIDTNHGNTPTNHGEAVAGNACTNITFRRNVWEDIEGTTVIGPGSNNGTDDNWHVYGNVFFYRNGNPNNKSGVDNGIFANTGNSVLNNSSFVNNTIINMKYGLSTRVYSVNGGTGNVAYNNLWYDNVTAGAIGFTTDYNYYILTTHTTETNQQISPTSDPFVGWTTNNFRLVTNTNARTATSLDPIYDQDGVQIISSRGAFQFVTGGSPATSYNPSSLTFAETPVGHGTVTQTITLTNVGNATLNFTSAVASGTNSADFRVSHNCGATVLAGVSCTITVYFNPGAAGSRSGSVTVTSSAASSPDVLPLSGTAVTKSSIALVGVPQ